MKLILFHIWISWSPFASRVELYQNGGTLTYKLRYVRRWRSYGDHMEHRVPTFAKSIIVKLSFPSYVFLKQPISLKEQSILTSNYRNNVQPYFSLSFSFFFFFLLIQFSISVGIKESWFRSTCRLIHSLMPLDLECFTWSDKYFEDIDVTRNKYSPPKKEISR